MSSSISAQSILLGVNVDHVATLRQARQITYPDPVYAALLAEQNGADSIVVHLREDRRHIQDRDVSILKEVLHIPMNLEMSATPAMVEIAKHVQPSHCCLVPEKRAEVTTEGGLNVAAQRQTLSEVCSQLKSAGIRTSFFIDPDVVQIKAAIACGVKAIELHTGHYCMCVGQEQEIELQRIMTAARFAREQGLAVSAGHGLHYHNVQKIAQILEITELNIGHSIIARAVFDGLPKAVKKMKQLMLQAR